MERPYEPFELDLYEAHGGKRRQIDPDTLRRADKHATECLKWLREEGKSNG